MKQRFWSKALILVLLFSLFPHALLAQNEETTDGTEGNPSVISDTYGGNSDADPTVTSDTYDNGGSTGGDSNNSDGTVEEDSTVTSDVYDMDIAEMEDLSTHLFTAKIGMDKSAEALKLPKRVGATLRNGSFIDVEVVWDLDATDYDPELLQPQQFTVKGDPIHLPEGVTNSGELAAYATVKILTPRSIIATAPISPITIAGGTSPYDIPVLLPDTIQATLDDHSDQMMGVWWETPGKVYDPYFEYTQNFSVVGHLFDKENAGISGIEDYTIIADVTAASVTESVYIVKRLNPNYFFNEMEAGAAPSAESLGLPSQVEVILGDDSAILADVEWDIANCGYDPSLNYGKDFSVQGQLVRLPIGITNPGFQLNAYLSTHLKTDIKEISLIQMQVENGAPNTVEGLELPTHVEVTLYNGSRADVPVKWNLEGTAYDSSVRTQQDFWIYGWLYNLPEDVHNSKNYQANAYIQVKANKDNVQISAFPDNQYVYANSGVPKTAEGFGLPSQIEVSLSNNTKTNVDVNWHLESMDYDPAATTNKSFWIYGEFIHLPEGVYNSQGYYVWAFLTVKPVYINMFYSYNIPYLSVENGAPKTVEGLKLPARIKVTLSNNEQVDLDVNWRLESLDYDPAAKKSQHFWVSGEFVNLPSGVSNSMNVLAGADVTVEQHSDYAEIAAAPDNLALHVKNGVPKTVEGFGLPSQVEVELSNNDTVTADVYWDLESVNYVPERKREETLQVLGNIVNLPDTVGNSGGFRVKADVTFEVENITSVFYVSTITANNGAPKTSNGLNLPAQVEATLSDHSKINVDVTWDVYHTSYDPEVKEQQFLYVFGTLTHLPDWVIYNGPRLDAYVTVKQIIEIVDARTRKFSNHSPDIDENRMVENDTIELPAQVEVGLSDGNLLKVDVAWGSRQYTSLEDYEIYGELIHLPADIHNSNGIKAKIEVSYTHTIVDIQPVEIRVKNAWEIGLKQPGKVSVTLDNGTRLLAGVSWHVFSMPVDWGVIYNSGTLHGLPDNVIYRSDSQWCNLTIIHESETGTGPPDPGALKKITDIESVEVHVHSVSDISSALPDQVIVTLDDASQMAASVNWYIGNMYAPDWNAIYTYGILYNLPDDVEYQPGEQYSTAIIVHDPTEGMEDSPDSKYNDLADQINAAFSVGIDNLSNMKVTLDTVAYSLIDSSIYAFADPGASTFDRVLSLFNFIPIGKFVEDGILYVRLESRTGKIIERGVEATDDNLNVVSKLPVVSKSIPIRDYNDIMDQATHNGFSQKVMLGKYDDGGPTSYITKAKDSGSAYFDLGEDWDVIKNRYNLIDDEMFKLFNEPFLDNGINQGKTFIFSHYPRNDNGFLRMEYEYLIENGYEFFVKGDGWIAIPI